MRITVLVIFLILTFNFTYCQEAAFTIEGYVKGISDNTVLFLDYTDDDKNISIKTTVLKGQFSFKGKIKSKAVNAVIHNQNYSNYKFFWLENNKITFNAVDKKFREAKITGSQTQIEDEKFYKLIDSLPEQERIKQEQMFVQQNPNSIISAHLLSVYCTTWGKDITTALFNNFSDELKNSNYGKKISNYILLNKNIKIGDKYFDFSQTNTENKNVKLSDFDGKVVLLEFWGSWCGPCRENNPELVKLYAEFKNKGFEIFGVAAENNKQNWLKAVKKDKLTWTNVTDLKGDNNEAVLIYGVSAFPTNFLIDKTGVIVAKDLGIKQLRKKLTELLIK